VKVEVEHRRKLSTFNIAVVKDVMGANAPRFPDREEVPWSKNPPVQFPNDFMRACLIAAKLA
jgi:hypothetical protein